AIQRGGGYTLHVPKAGRYLIAIAGGYGRDEVRVAFTHIPDPYEPDSFAQPRAVVLGQPVPFIASSPRDVDYFAFRVPAGNGVKVRLDQRAPYGVAVRLYEENAENPFVSGKQISRVSVRPG